MWICSQSSYPIILSSHFEMVVFIGILCKSHWNILKKTTMFNTINWLQYVFLLITFVSGIFSFHKRKPFISKVVSGLPKKISETFTTCLKVMETVAFTIKLLFSLIYPHVRLLVNTPGSVSYIQINNEPFFVHLIDPPTVCKRYIFALIR